MMQLSDQPLLALGDRRGAVQTRLVATQHDLRRGPGGPGDTAIHKVTSADDARNLLDVPRPERHPTLPGPSPRVHGQLCERGKPCKIALPATMRNLTVLANRQPRRIWSGRPRPAGRGNVTCHRRAQSLARRRIVPPIPATLRCRSQRRTTAITPRVAPAMSGCCARPDIAGARALRAFTHTFARITRRRP